MGSEVCPLYSCAEGTHTHTFGRVVQILLLSIIYIQRKLPLLLQSATIRCDGHTQESDLCKHGGKWLREAISHCCFPLLFVPAAQDPQQIGGAPVRTHGGRGSSSGIPAAQDPQQVGGAPVPAH